MANLKDTKINGDLNATGQTISFGSFCNIGIKLLWEAEDKNWSPGAQTLSVDGEDCDMIWVHYKTDSGSEYYESRFCLKGQYAGLDRYSITDYMGEANDSLCHYARSIKFTGSTVEIGECWRYFRRYSDHLFREYNQNWFLCPIYIYGIKFNK